MCMRNLFNVVTLFMLINLYDYSFYRYKLMKIWSEHGSVFLLKNKHREREKIKKIILGVYVQEVLCIFPYWTKMDKTSWTHNTFFRAKKIGSEMRTFFFIKKKNIKTCIICILWKMIKCMTVLFSMFTLRSILFLSFWKSKICFFVENSS